jgi:RNA polymerase sigma factor (sigma-70 family)
MGGRFDGAVDLARDRDLVERCQSGDRSAFEELYARYQRRLFHFCLKRLHEGHEAEDAVQESFARAWRALPTFGGERRFYPWLSVIAANICTDILRRRARVTPMEDAGDQEADRSAKALDEDLLTGVDTAMAVQALGRLNLRHQRVLQLREGRGWSAQQIADAEGMAVPAVETLLWRARQALKREFAALVESGGRLGAVLGIGLLAVRRWYLRRTTALAARLPVVPPGAGRGVVALVPAAALAAGTALGVGYLAGAGHTAPAGPAPATSGAGAAAGVAGTGAAGTGTAGRTGGGTAGPTGPAGAGAASGAGGRGSTGAAPGGGGGGSAGGGSGSGGAGAAVGGTVKGVAGGVGGTVSGVGGTVGGVAGGATSGAGGTVSGVTGAAGGAVSGLGGTVSGATGAAGGAVGGAAGGTVSGVGGAAGGAVSGAGGTVSGVGGTLGGTLGGLGGKLSGKG